MDRRIDVSAHLTFQSEGKQITLDADDGVVIIHFRAMSLVQISREMRVLDRMNILDKIWKWTRGEGVRVYLKYGTFKFRMPGPVFLKAFIRLMGIFERT